jgi:hypothetical protein
MINVRTHALCSLQEKDTIALSPRDHEPEASLTKESHIAGKDMALDPGPRYADFETWGISAIHV